MDIKKAHDVYNRFSHDEHLHELYEAREKWRKDHSTQLKVARMKALAEGEKKGEKKGKLEGKLEDAKKMLAKGLAVELIMDITELPLETINKLKQK